MDFSFKIDHKSPMPLYAQLADAIKEAINSGTLSVGEKLPSENELSEQCRLSRMTVRNALAELVNARYVEKLHGKGTFVSYRGVHPADAGSVDVLLDVTYSYFSMLYIKSISEVLSNNRYQFVIHDTRDSQKEICNILEQILLTGSAGVIVQPFHTVEPILPELTALLDALQTRGIPYVLLDRGLEGVPGARTVFDDYAGGRLAAEYLTSLGHRRFAMVTAERFCENAPRRDGFNSVLREQGLAPLLTLEDGDERLLPLLKKEGITAVFNYNDETALHTMRLLQSAGLRIPEDLSVVGFDDTIITMATNPQLTSVIHPKEALGQSAAQRLIALMENKEIAEHTPSLKPRLHIQASCAAPKKQEVSQ